MALFQGWEGEGWERGADWGPRQRMREPHTSPPVQLEEGEGWEGGAGWGPRQRMREPHTSLPVQLEEVEVLRERSPPVHIPVLVPPSHMPCWLMCE